MSDEELLQCYNKGCGQKYKASENKNDSCRHHSGQPVFHDAYKGWSCCNKKCTDFTEFLNIKGCTISKHSNLKPPEPEKPANSEAVKEVIEVKPITRVTLTRPPYETPLSVITPNIASSLNDQTFEIMNSSLKIDLENVPIGTSCKNSGCSVVYQNRSSNEEKCIYHSGVPIFHEGLKFWSCCQKRTTDFNAFLNQIGCEEGKHLWFKEQQNDIKCRWDFHQTGSHVIVSIYAKEYCIKTSIVKLNPIRLYANLVFPKQSNRVFNIDIELAGVIDVNASQVAMLATKVEIKMKKAEPGSWSKLEIPRIHEKANKQSANKEQPIEKEVESVDLDDL